MDSALAGKRVVVTRRAEQQSDFRLRLHALGAEPISFPTIKLTALPRADLDDAMADIKTYDWLIFTSTNAVRFFFSSQTPAPDPAALPAIAAVGSATGALLSEHGYRVAAMPKIFTGGCLAHALGTLDGKRVLLPRAVQGRPEIVAALNASGAAVHDIALYETVMAQPPPQAFAAVKAGVDVVTFASPLTAQNFYKLIAPSAVASAVVACIGPTTADAVAALGLRVHVVASEYTIAGLADALVDYFREFEMENVHVRA